MSRGFKKMDERLNLRYIGYYRMLKVTGGAVLLVFLLLMGVPATFNAITGIIFMYVFFCAKTDFDKRIAVREIKRRLSPLGFNRSIECAWHNRGSIGFFAVDKPNQMMLFAGSQSNFDLLVVPLKQVTITEFSDHFEINSSKWNELTLIAFKNQI